LTLNVPILIYNWSSYLQGKLSAKNLLNIFKTSVCAMEVINILRKGINFLFTIKSICSICCVLCKPLLYLVHNCDRS